MFSPPPRSSQTSPRPCLWSLLLLSGLLELPRGLEQWQLQPGLCWEGAGAPGVPRRLEASSSHRLPTGGDVPGVVIAPILSQGPGDPRASPE